MSEHLLEQHIDELARIHPEKFFWLLCLECRGVYHAAIVMPAAVEVWQKCVSNTKCPGCGAKNNRQGVYTGIQARALMKPKDNPIPQDNIRRWLEIGRVGLSSRCMAMTALGGQAMEHGEYCYPHDPDDLNRCLLLLNMAPEVRQAFPKIRELNKQWEVLIDNWDKIESMFMEEAGLNFTKGAAIKTYALMQYLLDATGRDKGISLGNGVTMHIRSTI